MSKNKESDDSVQLNSADRDGLDKASGSPTEQELFKDFDEKRRSFLKKLLISAAYVTPAILSFSIRDSEARRQKKLPTRKDKQETKRGGDHNNQRIPAVNNVLADSQLAHHPNNVSGQAWLVSNLLTVILSKQD